MVSLRFLMLSIKIARARRAPSQLFSLSLDWSGCELGIQPIDAKFWHCFIIDVDLDFSILEPYREVRHNISSLHVRKRAARERIKGFYEFDNPIDLVVIEIKGFFDCAAVALL